MRQFGVVWGHLAGILGRFGGVLGHLGGSLALLGGLVCLLGGSWSILGAHGPNFDVLSSTRSAEAWNLGRFGGPKWDQKGTQNGPKSKTKTKTEKEAFEDRLGAVLGPSWVDLVTHLGSKK